MRQKRTNLLTRPVLTALAIMIALTLTAGLALAQSAAQVYLQEVEKTADTLVVEVMADNVTELYGAEFKLAYDPAVLAVQDFKPEQDGIQIEVGSLLPADKGFVVANQVDETAGAVTFAMTLLNPAPAVSGGGPLARLTFKVLQNSASTIEVAHAKLVALNLQTIPSETIPLAIGGDSQAQEPAQKTTTDSAAPAPVNPPSAGGSEFPWWIVAAVIMVLGILALGGFIVMGGMNKATATPVPPRQTQAERPLTYPTGSRPSAFKNNQLPTE
ncbi:MAG: cohesin domain-containing protein [Chloroflexota bacterium]